MARLNGKVAVITGGTTGIGLAAARLFQDEGARVIVTGRNPDTVAAAAKELPGVEVIRSDAADRTAIRALFEGIGRKYGHVDVLFLNAGIAQFAPIGETPDALLDDALEVNLKGPFHALQAALPLLRKGSSVIVNTSVVSDRGLPATAAYAASKAGLAAIVRVAANELAAKGIRVNAVVPGPIATPIFGKLGLPKEATDALAAQLKSTVPMQRMGSPEEVARGALFLASDEAAFVTGHELAVDGGVLAA